MMGGVYVACLVVSIASMVLIDWRWRLAFWTAPWLAGVSIGVGVGVMLVWDVAGIALDVFYVGSGQIATGIMLAPQLPIEEPVFLTFLCYLTLLLVTGLERLLAQRERGSRS